MVVGTLRAVRVRRALTARDLAVNHARNSADFSTAHTATFAAMPPLSGAAVQRHAPLAP